MASAFDTLFGEQGRSALQAAFGRSSVVYYATEGAATGTALTLASIGAETSYREPEEGPAGEVLVRQRAATISTDAANGGVASPAERAEVEIDGERWSVEGVEALSGSMARLVLVRREAVERTRPGDEYASE